MVNTASKCGFTPQYRGLEELYQRHRDAGFVVLGFPCNQFAHQEPGSAEEIAGFQQEMDAVDADWQFVNFAGAVHCFAESDANSPPNCVYHERSAKRAWRMMDDFFEERFGQRSA